MSKYKNGDEVLWGGDYDWIPAYYIGKGVDGLYGHVITIKDDGHPRLINCSESLIKPKPKTWVINGFEVPAPIPKGTDVNDIRVAVFLLTFDSDAGFKLSAIKSSIFKGIKSQMAFYTREDARKNVAALRGTYEEEFGNEN